MKWRPAIEWLVVACLGVALGLGVAWTERSFAIPKFVVSVFFLALFSVAAGFAVWAAWRYYRAIRDDDDWE